MTMFLDNLQHIHINITEQSAAQLREFLVTAHQRHQSDSQVLSIGLQALRQEVLDEGFDWSDLITNLINLICADLHEDQHMRFVADLDRLYSSNASLSEVRYVMASDYPSTLNVLQLLIQEAQKEHEALTATAGGTSSRRRDPSRTDKGRKKERTKDVAEALYAGVAVTGGIVGVSMYRKVAALERTGVNDLQAKYEDQNRRFSDGEIENTVDQITPRHVKHTYYDGYGDHYDFDDVLRLRDGYRSISTEFDFKGYARLDRIDKTPQELRDLMRKDANTLLDRINNGDMEISKVEREMTSGLVKSDYGTISRDLNIEKLINHPEFNDYYDSLRGIDKFQEFNDKFGDSNAIDDYIRSEGAKAVDFKYKEYWNQDQYNEYVKNAKYDELINNARAAGVNPSQLDREAENEVSLDGGNIEEFVPANPDATEIDLKPATKALLDPDKQIDPDDVDEDNLVSKVMSDQTPLVTDQVNFRKAEREARRALNNNGLRIQPDDKIGGQNDAGRLDNNGGIDSLLEAPQNAAGTIETGVDEQIEEVLPQMEEQAMSEIVGVAEKEVVQTGEAVDKALETAEESEL